jgi:hypothetical protein
MATAVLKNRVKESTATTGTGPVTLAGASDGFQSFNTAFANGDTVYYTIVGGTQWEVGIGVFTSSGTTLSRDVVLSSSNAGSLVNFSAGSKDVFCTVPAERIGIKLLDQFTFTGSETLKDFTGIPAGVNRLTGFLDEFSTNGTSLTLIQIGDSGGIENTGYKSVTSQQSSGIGAVNSTAGFILYNNASTIVSHGMFELRRMSGNKWAFKADLNHSDGARTVVSSGIKTLSAELTQVRFTTVSGTDTIDSGSMANLSYEF